MVCSHDMAYHSKTGPKSIGQIPDWSGFRIVSAFYSGIAEIKLTKYALHLDQSCAARYCVQYRILTVLPCWVTEHSRDRLLPDLETKNIL